MMEDEQRIEIAKACGWRFEPHSAGTRLIRPDGYVVNEHYAEPWRLPDYLSDLNSMHAAILSVIAGDESKEKKFIFALEDLMENDDAKICLYKMDVLISPAKRLAEAFLRTIGKWVD